MPVPRCKPAAPRHATSPGLLHTGPATTAAHQVQPEQLRATVHTLEAAVQACMAGQFRQGTSSHAMPGQLIAPGPDRTSEPGVVAVRMMQSVDSTAVAALFGCAGYLLRFQCKAYPHTAAVVSNLNSASTAQQAQQPAGKPGAKRQHEGQHHTSGKEDECGDADIQMDLSNATQDSELPWSMSTLTEQVVWMTEVLKLPWQLQSRQHQAQPGR